MRKLAATLAALAATAALAWSFFGLPKPAAEAPPATPRLARVWVSGQESALWGWLRKEARQFEKETGTRVYLRSVPARDALPPGGDPPDLLISDTGETPVALRGYALFYRNDAARAVTPYPTSLLFFQPSPTPGPSPTPAPTPDMASFSVILTPEQLALSIPGGVRSANPMQDFIDGKGDAAVLTAEQAGQLPFHAGVFPLPEGKGALPIRADAFSSGGEAFLSFLLSEPAQRALTETGLFSPVFPLYRGAGSLRELIENSL